MLSSIHSTTSSKTSCGTGAQHQKLSSAWALTLSQRSSLVLGQLALLCRLVQIATELGGNLGSVLKQLSVSLLQA